MGEDYSRCFAWSLDFVQAMTRRPLLVRLLLHWLMGKHAYREFIGIIGALADQGYFPSMGYELEGMEYHKDRVPLDYLRAGKERKEQDGIKSG